MITEDHFIDITFVLGSGYGVAIADDSQNGGSYAVVLVNEDPGEILCTLRRFSNHETALRSMDKFVDSVVHRLEEGAGVTFQSIGDPTYHTRPDRENRS